MVSFHRRRSRVRRHRLNAEQPDAGALDPGSDSGIAQEPDNPASSPQFSIASSAVTSPVSDPVPPRKAAHSDAAPPSEEGSPKPLNDASDRESDERELERGLRGLVGSGSSQVSISAALRARDASRPTDEDIAAAERELVIVRRHWVPRDALPPPTRPRR